jgi:quercetin 2,3-dioxygenase
MIEIRKAPERGRTRLEWLDSRHSFSFGDYHDPKHMGFRDLRVINDDRVAPAGGFATHGHRDMEIVTYVLDGELEHRDSLGNGSVIRPGEVQRMSAGTGIMHSEFNPSRDKPVHFLQIWILPEKNGLKPGYEQRSFDRAASKGKFVALADHDGDGHVLTVHQDVKLSVATLEANQTAAAEVKPGRFGWLQVARGAVTVDDQELHEGDGAAISNETRFEVKGIEPAEVLLFDLR